jgi:hypothetical protein
MSNILAAIGRGQLEVLDERVNRRREIFEGYRQRLGDLPGVSFMPEPVGCRGNRWLTVVLIDPAVFGADTHAVREALEAENIEARPLVEADASAAGVCRMRVLEEAGGGQRTAVRAGALPAIGDGHDGGRFGPRVPDRPARGRRIGELRVRHESQLFALHPGIG